MVDYRDYFIACYTRGDFHYNDSLNDIERGAVEVYHDNKRYIYSMPDNKRDFRWWLEHVFDSGDGAKVTGSYPTYRIESK